MAENNSSFPEAKINNIELKVWCDCPHCGMQNDDEYELDEFSQPDAFSSSCWSCKQAYHVKFPLTPVNK